MDSGLKLIQERFMKKVERDVEEVEKKASNALKNNIDRMRKVVASCETKVG